MSDENAKIVGHQSDETGETYGVLGGVDSADGYGLYTPDDVKIDGDVVAGEEWRVVVEELGDAGNIVQGGPNNSVDSNSDAQTVGGGENNTTDGNRATVAGGANNEASGTQSTVAGGRNNIAGEAWSTVSGGGDNEATGQDATVGGGYGNEASGDRSTVGGGEDNEASETGSTVSGGWSNEASGSHATVLGGRNNSAEGDYSVAVGRNANATRDGQFVFTDSSTETDTFPTGITNRFYAMFNNGYRFLTDTTDGDAGVWMGNGATSWSSISSAEKKTDITPVDTQEVLEKVSNLEISTWAYEWKTETRHMGPMAGDLYEAFGLGDSDEGIQTIDADGVLFAAVNGLAEKLEAKDERIDELEKRLAAIEARI